MATEVIDILDHEKLDKVHAVGHDFGSHLLSRVVNYYPGRLLSCTFIAVPYSAPGQHFDLDKIKEITEKALGFEKYGYMRFMNRDDSPEMFNAHVCDVSIHSRSEPSQSSFRDRRLAFTFVIKSLFLPHSSKHSRSVPLRQSLYSSFPRHTLVRSTMFPFASLSSLSQTNSIPQQESFTSLIYTSDYARHMNFYPTGELEKWLTADNRLPQSSSVVSEAENSTHNQIFSEGGYRGPTNWYRALVRNLNEDDEKAAIAAGTLDPQIKCPVLAIDSAPGRASTPGFMEGGMGPFAKDFRYKVAKTEGHWVQIESPGEVNQWLDEFFKEVEG